MIKQLIQDIAYDNIQLSHALTRAKLISAKVKNEIFLSWLKKELEGYDFQDVILPQYRKIRTVLNLTIDLGFGRQQTLPVSFNDTFDPEFVDLINFHRILEPIAIIEQQLNQLDGPEGIIVLTPEITQIVGRPFENQIKQQGGAIRSAHKEFNRAQFINVVELTKQKLLDTLLELDSEFPDLINDFTMSTENKEKIQNIITNNIYGSNNPLNIATGQNVEQKNIQNIFSEKEEQQLETLGVEKKDINNLKQIITTTKEDKKSFQEKAMKWLGSVSASIAGRGLYENIPAITEFIQKLIQ
jgi:hypothetical protein